MAVAKDNAEMAQMFPRSLPQKLLCDPKRSAEVQVYEALRDQLPARFHVFYSFSWVSKRPGGRALDGEADFVIADPDRGILVLEVKGGRIGYDGACGKWTTTDRDGCRHEIDPVAQLRAAKFALIDKLRSVPAWGNRWVQIGHCVAFPHCTLFGSQVTADLPREIVIGADEMCKLSEKIEAIYRYWTSQNQSYGIGSDGMDILADILAPTFELRQPLGPALREEDRQILRLTEEQFNLLETLKWNPRVAVSGGAGTGKTVLALEKAKRLAAEGHRTLLVCYNRPLADFLRVSAGPIPNLTVQSFHQLCVAVAQRAGIDLTVTEDQDVQRRFDEELPMALIEAIAENPDEQVDAIVVDEGQDFSDQWWHAVHWLLRDGEEGTLYIFYDDNQRVYRRQATLPRGLVRATLTRNLRNTKPIFAIGQAFYKGAEIHCSGPEGRPPQLLEASDDQARVKVLSRVLHHLIREQRVVPGDICVLTPRRLANSCIGQADHVGAFPIAVGSRLAVDRVQVETVRRFKGLERPVIILMEVEDIGESDEVMYVGVTRARLHLVIIAKPEVLNRIVSLQQRRQ
ncbi:NERD domain-containing protein [Fontivita pretiosa]|uniref:NERD domain-containing protein n=1 Tax=Fontivita pretiosa TaxID=2989684 RepID=UPI003D165C21